MAFVTQPARLPVDWGFSAKSIASKEDTSLQKNKKKAAKPVVKKSNKSPKGKKKKIAKGKAKRKLPWKL